MEIDKEFEDITEKDYEDYDRRKEFLMNFESFIYYFVGFLFGKNEKKIIGFLKNIFHKNQKED